MLPPEGYAKALPGQVQKLQRSIYGLKKSWRKRNVELTKFLTDKGFKQCKSDDSLFTKLVNSKVLFILVYVDDLLITGNDVDSIVAIKKVLHSAFSIEDIGLACDFLGLELAQFSRGIFHNQKKYILDILKDVEMIGAKPVLFPLILLI